MRKLILIILVLVIMVFGYYFYDHSFHTESVPVEDVCDELFCQYYSKADKILSNMSLKEKVGQLFFVRYDYDSLEEDIKNYYPGGYVLFAKDFENHTKDSLTQELNRWQDTSKIPLAFAVDEEGGTVTRVSRYPAFRESKFLSVQDIYNSGGYEALEATEKEKANLLLSLGIHVNLAPVADVSVDPNDFIYARSFGKDAKETSKYIKHMVQYANDSGISSCLKHFPGYGNNLDTHNGSAIDQRSYDSFVESDFLPFEAGIKEDVPMILVSHNIMNCVDSEYPSSLSKKVISILRNKLDFSGIVITDDLAMGAIDSYREKECVTCLAMNAGNDIMIVTDFHDAYQELLQGVKEKKVSMKKINTAVRRVLAWKLAYKMIDYNNINS